MGKIGVCICDCGKTLFAQEDAARIISQLSQHGQPCEDVFHVHALCTENELLSFTSTIKEKNFEKLVIAGCSPVRNQAMLERLAAYAGLTPSAVYGVNIREQLLLHITESERGLEKLNYSIRKAIRIVSDIPAFETKIVPLYQHVLVVGNAISGIFVAQELHHLGYAVTLVKQNGSIEDRFDNEIFPEQWRISPTIPAGVDTFTKSSLLELQGSIGEFSARINTPSGEKTLRCGVVVIAHGGPAGIPEKRMPRTPESLRQQSILSMTEMSQALVDLSKRRGMRAIGLVLDVEIDETETGTELALTLAKNIQRMKRYQVYLFCRHLRVASKGLELLYDEAREAGVSIIKYEDNLLFHDTDGRLALTYMDAILHRKMTVLCDRVGVSPFGFDIPTDPGLVDIVGLSTDAYGHIQENNIHLFPEKTNRPGIFVLGSCRGRSYHHQVMAEAKAAALEIHTLLSQKSMRVELSNAVVDPDKCVLCLTCIRSCPHKAMQINREKGTAESIPEACQKCGICAGECPAKAIELPVYSDKVLFHCISS